MLRGSPGTTRTVAPSAIDQCGIVGRLPAAAWARAGVRPRRPGRLATATSTRTVQCGRHRAACRSSRGPVHHLDGVAHRDTGDLRRPAVDDGVVHGAGTRSRLFRTARVSSVAQPTIGATVGALGGTAARRPGPDAAAPRWRRLDDQVGPCIAPRHRFRGGRPTPLRPTMSGRPTRGPAPTTGRPARQRRTVSSGRSRWPDPPATTTAHTGATAAVLGQRVRSDALRPSLRPRFSRRSTRRPGSWRARCSMRFSPADSPLSLSRMERFRHHFGHLVRCRPSATSRSGLVAPGTSLGRHASFLLAQHGEDLFDLLVVDDPRAGPPLRWCGSAGRLRIRSP